MLLVELLYFRGISDWLTPLSLVNVCELTPVANVPLHPSVRSGIRGQVPIKKIRESRKNVLL